MATANPAPDPNRHLDNPQEIGLPWPGEYCLGTHWSGTCAANFDPFPPALPKYSRSIEWQTQLRAPHATHPTGMDHGQDDPIGC